LRQASDELTAGLGRLQMIEPQNSPPRALRTGSLPLTRAQRLGLVAFGMAIVAFGAIVEMRSAFLLHRRTDLDVYLRAAWAVRNGRDIYAIADEHNWHYHYPPLFAILITPLADPPPGQDRSGTLPFPVSVAIWYVLNILFVGSAVHILARAFEDESPLVRDCIGPVGSRGWWSIRIIPVLTCLPGIGATLARSEANLPVLLLICAMIAQIMRRRSLLAGLFMALSISLKVFPAFLIVYPLFRRDLRMLTGCAIGLAVSLCLIPSLVFGPRQTIFYWQEWSHVLAAPALGSGLDKSRFTELIGVTSTDSQSFQTIIHNTIHLNETLHLDRGDRSTYLASGIRAAHWVIGVLLTLATLAVAGWRRCANSLYEGLLAGCLTVVMILLSPVCHLHYFALVVPLVMGLLVFGWQTDAAAILTGRQRLLFGLNVAGTGLPHLPALQIFKDLGLAMYVSLALWAAGLFALWHGRQASASMP
jgi:hypothetical protein